MPNTFKARLKQLVFSKKLVLIGSALLIISVFFPWYKDIDRFKIGETFLGITGPLYLAGFIVLIAAINSFVMILFKLLDKPAPKLPLQENQLHIIGSGLSLLMLIITASVYFHSKFGINLTEKSVGSGMILAFIGSGLVMLGAILSIKARNVDFEHLEGHIEPLIEMNLHERERADLGVSGVSRDTTIEEAMAVQRQQEAYRKPADNTKSWGPVQESINHYMPEDSDNTKDIK